MLILCRPGLNPADLGRLETKIAEVEGETRYAQSPTTSSAAPPSRNPTQRIVSRVEPTARDSEAEHRHDGSASVASSADFLLDDAGRHSRVTTDRERRFAAFVATHRDRAVGLAWRLVGDSSTAEDIAQEAFARAFRAAIIFSVRFRPSLMPMKGPQRRSSSNARRAAVSASPNSRSARSNSSPCCSTALRLG